MCLETAQILCTVQRMYLPHDQAEIRGLYRKTHQHHPCTVWAHSNRHTYDWLYALFQALLNEYTHRYGKNHACSVLLEVLEEPPERMLIPRFSSAPIPPKIEIGSKKFKLPKPALAMPNEYKLSHGMKPNPSPTDASPIHSYRNYYVNGKGRLAAYTNREAPEWLNDYPDALNVASDEELFLGWGGMNLRDRIEATNRRHRTIRPLQRQG